MKVSSIKKIIILFFSLVCVVSVYSQRHKNKNDIKQEGKEKQASLEPIKLKLKSAPVVPFHDTIFYVYGNVGSFSANQRASAINKRIKELDDDYSFNKDSLLLSDNNGFLYITYKDDILVSIDTLQAAYLGKTKKEIGQYYVNQIVKSIEKHREETSWKTISFQIAGVLAILLVEYLLIFKLLSLIYRKSRVYIVLQKGRRIKGLFGIIDADKEVQFFIWILNFIRFLVVLVFLYLGLLVVFKIFPYTKHISDQLLGYVISPLKSFSDSIFSYMPNLFTIIVTIIIFRYFQKFIRSIAEKISEGKITFRGFYPDWAFPTYNILSVLLYIFMFIIIFPYLPKSDSQIFQGVSVFAGLMLSLGSTSIIGNLVAGLVITYMRPFKLGDRIKMGDFVGNVIEKTALVTRIKTPKNEVITIPNSNVMSAQTINYSFSAREYGLILYTTITVGYEVPWQKAHELLLEVARRTNNLSKTQKPFILQDAFSDFYVEYQLNVYVKDADLMAKVYSDLRQNAQDVFYEHGIELVSPHYRVNRNVENYEEETIKSNPYRKKEVTP